MSCDVCTTALIKQKLGRCTQCMWMNFILLAVTGSIYYWFDINTLPAVQRVAFIMFLGSLGLLMVAHLSAWSFYRWKGSKKL
ncbi:DUF3624 family protein [Psychromonas arctica]|uniref:DUF3624 family protein n=1 Tax=Psychromonas arctica TaxID=168275 RepID=UPI00040CED11|nr:DUF3624 family protein [Psychromonas arctica]